MAVITGDNSNNSLFGTAGDDTVSALAGNDTIAGSLGNDSIDGGLGRDTLIFALENSLDFPPATGHVTYTLTATAFTNSVGTINTSFTGIERFTFSSASPFGANIDASAWAPAAGTTVTFTRFTLSGGNNNFIGTAYDDTLSVSGGGSTDANGGAGQDDFVLTTIDTGGAIVITSSGATLSVVQGTSIASSFTNFEFSRVGSVDLGAVGQIIDASGSSIGVGMMDGAGDDVLIGGSGNDIFVTTGAAGYSIGRDILTGGGGNDMYDFIASAQAMDGTIITDFSVGDFIDFNFNDPAFGVANLINNFIGSAAFSGTAGEYRFQHLGGETIVQFDSNGDVVADGTLRIRNGEFDLEEFSGDNGDRTLRIDGSFGVFNGTIGNDTLSGSADRDFLSSGDGNDVVYGLDGNDQINGGAGADTMYGGMGDDRYFIDSASDVVVELAGQGHDRVFVSTNFTLNAAIYANVEGVVLVGSATEARGNAANNEVGGNALDNILYGLGGDDLIVGRAGNDTLNGGTGNDTLRGGAGDDLYFVDAAGDSVEEWAGEGVDEVRASVNWTLSDHVDNLRLSGGGTVGVGNAQDNIIRAGAGATTLSGLDGNDTLYGSASADILNGGNGADYIYGRNGNDTVDGGDGDDTIVGEIGSDILSGGADNDLLLGGDGIDTLFGGDNSDDLRGGNQNDALYGEDGDDALRGEAGNDQLYGGAGRDFFTGGDGADGFWFADGDFSGTTLATADRVVDFAQGTDRIRLNLVDAVAGGADNSFAFIGAAAFSGTAGQLRYQISGANTFVYGDVDGDMVADFAISFAGTISFIQSDFVL